MQTRNALGFLIHQYKHILHKCRYKNALSRLVPTIGLASVIALGGAGATTAQGADITVNGDTAITNTFGGTDDITTGAGITADLTINYDATTTGTVTIDNGSNITLKAGTADTLTTGTLTIDEGSTFTVFSGTVVDPGVKRYTVNGDTIITDNGGTADLANTTVTGNIDATKNSSGNAANFYSTITLKGSTIDGSVLQGGNSATADGLASSLTSSHTAPSTIGKNALTEVFRAASGSTLQIGGDLTVKKMFTNAPTNITEVGNAVIVDGATLDVGGNATIERSLTFNLHSNLIVGGTLKVEGTGYKNESGTLTSYSLDVKDRINFTQEGIDVYVGTFDNTAGYLTQTGENSRFRFGSLTGTENLIIGSGTEFEIGTYTGYTFEGNDFTVNETLALSSGTEGNTTSLATGDLSAETIVADFWSEINAHNLSFGSTANNNDISYFGGNVVLSENLVVEKGNVFITRAQKIPGYAFMTVAGEAQFNRSSGLIVGPDFPTNTPTQVAWNALNANTLDAHLAVGQNAQLSIGTADPTGLANVVTNLATTGYNVTNSTAYKPLTWGEDITAALYLDNANGGNHTVASNGTLFVNGNVKGIETQNRASGDINDDITTFTDAYINGSAIHEVDNSDPTTLGNANFAAKSLLVVTDAAKLNSADNFALSGNDKGTTGHITVAEGARLHVLGAAANQDIYIADFGSGTFTGWNEAKNEVTADSALLMAALVERNPDEGTYIIRFNQQSANEIAECLDESTSNFIDEVIANYGTKTDSGTAGFDFINQSFSKDYVFDGNNPNLSGAYIENAASLAAGLGVNKNLLDISAAQRKEIKKQSAAGAKSGDSSTGRLFLSTIYHSTNVDPSCLGCYESGYESDFYGLTMGGIVDVGDSTFGGTLVMGRGDTDTTGDYNNMANNNDFSTTGVTIFASHQINNLTLSVDGGYIQSQNDISQNLVDAGYTLGASKNKAEVDAQAWTAAFRAAYKIPISEWANLTPYGEVEYANVKTDGYKVTNNGQTIFNVASDSQDLGFFTGGTVIDFNYLLANGWVLKPSLDLAYTFVSGDREANSKATMPGVNTQTDLRYTNMDESYFQGGVGFDISGNGLTFSVDYDYAKSKKQEDQEIRAAIDFRW